MGRVLEQFLAGQLELGDALVAAETLDEAQMIADCAAALAADAAARPDYNRSRSSGATGPCAECGRSGSDWNCGAGRFLCDRHWDEY